MLLRDVDSWRLFTPFIKTECSVGEAAKQVGVPLRKMYGFVQKGLRLGLLDTTRTEPRKGRAVRFYRAVSEQFFVAFEDMTALNFADDLLEGWHRWEKRVYAATARHFEEVFARAEAKGTGPWGRLYGRAEGGNFSQLTFASEKGFTKEPEVWRAEDVEPFIAGMGVFKLSHEQMRAFQRWLDALDRDVLNREEGNQSYYLELTLVKLGES